MIGLQLLKTYEQMRDAGLVRSKRDFARRWCARGKTFLRDYEREERQGNIVSPRTVAVLRARLCALAGHLPEKVSLEIVEIIKGIERDCQTAAFLKRN